MDDLASARVRIQQARVKALDVGYQHLTSNGVPGQTIGLRPDRKSPQLLAGVRVEYQQMTVASSCGEHEFSRIRCVQDSAAFRAARQCALQMETGTVNDVDGAVASVRDEHTAGGWMDIAVVETTTQLGGQHDAACKCEGRCRAPTASERNSAMRLLTRDRISSRMVSAEGSQQAPTGALDAG